MKRLFLFLLAATVDLAAAEDASPGRYVALMGDCAACHTATDGKPFAGGLAIPSPFGEIYASNITPDPTYGIGGYTLAEFNAAVRQGIRKDGANLYPAMPYTSYAKISDDDIAVLYDFFVNEVAPVPEPVTKTALAFPFNQRWGVRSWNLINRPRQGFDPPFDDPVLNRGAYLVEGLGHCGACHTPRNELFAEKAYDASDAAFLAGGTLGNRSVPDLRGADSAAQKWSEDELVEFLATGRNTGSGVTGEMAIVVELSLQHATNEDLRAIARYLKAIGDDREKSRKRKESDNTTALLTAAKPDMPLGARLYLDNCGACHTVSGQGAPRTIPDLVGNSTVIAEDPAGLISIILDGARMPSTRKAPAALAMPGFAARLNDTEVATLASFVRSAWTNDAAPVDETAIEDIRTAR